MNAQKNDTLDILKLFASFMVVFVHVWFAGRLGPVMDALARFAVPLFFIVSGFYSYHIPPKKIGKRLWNIVKLLILALICYTLLDVFTAMTGGNPDAVGLYFSKYTNPTTLTHLHAFNVPITSVHLWYLFAITYVYIIFYLVTVLRVKDTIIYIVAALLLLFHLLLGEGFPIFGFSIPVRYVRNYALMGIPFFSAGLLAKKYEHKLRAVPNIVVILSLVIGFFAALYSRDLYGRRELYIGTLFTVFALVVIFIKYAHVQYPRCLTALSGCSTYIYIFHMIVYDWVKRLYAFFGVSASTSATLQNLQPILVCIISLALAFGIVSCQRLLRSKRKNVATAK